MKNFTMTYCSTQASGEAIKDPCCNFVQGLEGIAFARQPKFDTTELIMYCPRLSPSYEDKARR